MDYEAKPIMERKLSTFWEQLGGWWSRNFHVPRKSLISDEEWNFQITQQHNSMGNANKWLKVNCDWKVNKISKTVTRQELDSVCRRWWSGFNWPQEITHHMPEDSKSRPSPLWEARQERGERWESGEGLKKGWNEDDRVKLKWAYKIDEFALSLVIGK